MKQIHINLEIAFSAEIANLPGLHEFWIDAWFEAKYTHENGIEEINLVIDGMAENDKYLIELWFESETNLKFVLAKMEEMADWQQAQASKNFYLHLQSIKNTLKK